jgi:hydrogenase expression/formation protein HypE
MTGHSLPLGKLPAEMLAKMLAGAPQDDERVLLGPGIGLDCAVVSPSSDLLVFKSDPITFATDNIGWYGVQVAANDIVTTGAIPRWYLVTLLLPEGATDAALVEAIRQQLFDACRQQGVSLIGGHTEITYGLTRPILMGTMIGEVPPERLITPRGARPGDVLLLTKGVPIEATALLAREVPDRLKGILSEAELQEAAAFLHSPGISVVREAQIAMRAGRVTAMHDPTEGGLAGALWELAQAAGCSLRVDVTAVPVPPLSRRICAALGLNPLSAIASGALLMTVAAEDACIIQKALQNEGIACAQIGYVEKGETAVFTTEGIKLARPERDEIARVFETN